MPVDYLCNNKDYLQGIIDGLTDSDGHIESNGRVRFTNTSEQLIELFNVCFIILLVFMLYRFLSEQKT